MNRITHLLLLLAFILPPFTHSRLTSTAWQSKVDPWVLETVVQESPTEFILFLKEQADLSGAKRLTTKLEKGRYVFEQLTSLAERTQKPILQRLQTLSANQPGRVEYRPYWVANMIWVRGDAGLLQEMALRSDIAHIYANPQVQLDAPQPASPITQTPSAATVTIEWNIVKVGAPQAWAYGYTGQGVVIGGQDTGYAWEHPALKGKYRGWDGTTANHNYSWHDAIHSGDDPICPPDIPYPCDDTYHGTHTMGTMVGDDGAGYYIGMAPGARWIGCRNMRRGVGTPITYSECYQWFIAPTDLNNENPRPDLAPDVINNSWSCPPGEGCTDPNVLLTVVNNVVAAGIVTVHSAGNSGPACGTVSTPAAIYDASFTVGNTDSNDVIHYSSSRGPVTVDGSNRLKPDISAPGTSVRSSVPPTGYASLTGTSMAGPHVAGLVALMLSAEPMLSGNVEQIETLIKQSAVPRTTSQLCGDIPGSQVPNNTYGYGRIDAYKTFQGVFIHDFALQKTPSFPLYDPGGIITYTLQITHEATIFSTTHVLLRDVLPEGVNFITATQPYTRTGDLFEWGFPFLLAGESRSVQLVVQVPMTATQGITNWDYSVQSDDVAQRYGQPVTIYKAFYFYLPWIFRPSFTPQ